MSPTHSPTKFTTLIPTNSPTPSPTLSPISSYLFSDEVEAFSENNITLVGNSTSSSGTLKLLHSQNGVPTSVKSCTNGFNNRQVIKCIRVKFSSEETVEVGDDCIRCFGAREASQKDEIKFDEDEHLVEVAQIGWLDISEGRVAYIKLETKNKMFEVGSISADLKLETFQVNGKKLQGFYGFFGSDVDKLGILLSSE